MPAVAWHPARRRAPGTAFDLVELQRPVDALPQVVVANRHELAEPFPAPAALAPLVQLAPDAAAHVAAAGEQRDARRLVECFQAANDGQQLEPAGAGSGSVSAAEKCSSPPTDCSTNFQLGWRPPSSGSFGVEQKVRVAACMACASSRRVGRGVVR